jgi:hypothetical protein
MIWRSFEDLVEMAWRSLPKEVVVVKLDLDDGQLTLVVPFAAVSWAYRRRFLVPRPG